MLICCKFVSFNLMSHDVINSSTLFFVFFLRLCILFFVNDDNEEGVESIGLIVLLATLSTIFFPRIRHIVILIYGLFLSFGIFFFMMFDCWRANLYCCYVIILIFVQLPRSYLFCFQSFDFLFFNSTMLVVISFLVSFLSFCYVEFPVELLLLLLCFSSISFE